MKLRLKALNIGMGGLSVNKKNWEEVYRIFWNE